MTQLAPARIELAEFRRSFYSVRAEASTEFSEVLNDHYWAHVSERLRPGDRIEVRREDDAWFGEVLVLDAGKLYAKVAQLSYVEFYGELKNAATKDGGYLIEWRGPVKRWCGYYDKDELADKMNKAQAVAWLEERKGKPKAA